MSYAAVDGGELAAVVTYLEMNAPPQLQTVATQLSLRRIEIPVPHAYRSLFRLVGAPWLWFSRLALNDSEITAIVQNAGVDLYEVITETGQQCGMLELDFRETDQCELAFVGLVPTLSGQGHGRWLLSEALRLAWRDGIERVHVHTCSLDHPAALSAYRRAGFTPFKRAVERFPDPRLSGLLPRDCAPHVPLIGTDA